MLSSSATIPNTAPALFRIKSKPIHSTKNFVSSSIFFYVMFFHAWIGMLHITEDYIKWFAIRRAINFCFLVMIVLQILILSFYLIQIGVVDA